MTQTRDTIMAALSTVALPDGGDLATRGMVRALTIEGGKVSFVIEADSPEQAADMESQRRAAEAAVADLDGVEQVSVILTAHGPAQKQPEPPQLKIGGHPTPQAGPEPIAGVKKVIAVASGKGGVGKSTVSSNLAVALARAGKKVGLLDADIYGPSQHRMMGVTRGPASPDGKTMLPVEAHGVKVISIGMLVEPDQAPVWRGPMLMGALQQLMFKVDWGDLDVLIVDLPPGTGDVQLTLAQKTQVDGAVVVSTPQDISLIDARKGIDMFRKVGVPILGLVENMSMYVCPDCGRTDHIFGAGGVKAEAKKMGVPLLAELPLALDVREAGDAGAPVATGEGPMAEGYAKLADALIRVAAV